MDWINHYLRSLYCEIDPLPSLDYRRNGLVDWQDLQVQGVETEMFRKFEEFGLGNNGICAAHFLTEDIYCVMMLSFNIVDHEWIAFRDANTEKFHAEAEKLSIDYHSIFCKSRKLNYHITKRESQCLHWVAMGKTDKQIALQMGLGRWTVVQHLKNAKEKLGCPNRAAAVALALINGIIRI